MGLESLIPKRNQPTALPEQKSEAQNSPYPFAHQQVQNNSVQEKGNAITKEDNVWPHREHDQNIPQFPKHTESFAKKFNATSEKENDRLPQKKQQESIFHIEVEKIRPNPYQPRRHFDEVALRELAKSVREYGVIQPIIVSKITKESEHGAEVEYQLIAGERRLLASKLAGLPRIPAIVRNLDHNNRHERLEIALIENIQRHDLNSIDEARAYARLSEEFGLTQREIAERVGKSREVVANTVRLLNLPREIQEALIAGRINESQARMMLSISDPARQREVFQKILGGHVSVRALEHESRAATPQTSEEKFWEKQLEERLGAPVKIIRKAEGGKIVITFYSDEERSGVLKKIVGDGEPA